LGVIAKFPGIETNLLREHVRKTESLMKALRIILNAFEDIVVEMETIVDDGFAYFGSAQSTFKPEEFNTREISTENVQVILTPIEIMLALKDIMNMHKKEFWTKKLILDSIDYLMPSDQLENLESEWTKEINIDYKKIQDTIKRLNEI